MKNILFICLLATLTTACKKNSDTNLNPTSTVELPQPAAPGMTFRVTDLAGRLVLQKQTEAGSQQQTVQTGDLPDGLYFLQVVQDGRVLAVEKFVKQH